MHRRTLWILIGLLALLGAGCSTQAATPATATPAPVEEATGPLVSATGKVVPVQWTELSFTMNGDVVELAVEAGDTVQEGDLIARLDATDLESDVAQAEAALAEAEASLADAMAGPSEEEIRAAEQALSAAYARTSAAVARRDALYEPPSEAEMLDAQNQLFEAQREMERARQDLEWMENFDPDVCRNFWNDDRECPLSLWGPIQDTYDLAQIQVEAAQTLVNELQRGPQADKVAVENARIWLASAQAELAKAQLEVLRAQPWPEDVRIAQAEVEQAQADLEAAQAQLTKAELYAPFAGTVTDVLVDINEFVSAGQTIVQLGDLSTLRVETTDLNEIDVARVEVGDTAIVTFDALPDVEVTGTVTRIAPLSSEGTGVNYPVVIEVDEMPEAVRWGMTAFVDIEVE